MRVGREREVEKQSLKKKNEISKNKRVDGERVHVCCQFFIGRLSCIRSFESIQFRKSLSLNLGFFFMGLLGGSLARDKRVS